MSEHPDIDMISFTGSTRAGVDVAKRAAPTVKRVSQELGGKSPNVILDGADLAKAVTGGVMHMFNNSGQSCNAPTRMIVPLSKMKEVAAIAKGVADKTKAGDPRAEGTTIGPVVSRIQWDKIQALIKKGIEEGATLVAGGPGLPEGVNKGFYVRPTIFADVTNEMTIAREEIFGPVLTIIGAKDEAEAVKIANDTPYGLAGYVTGDTVESARRVAGRSAPATSTCRACRTTAPRRSAATSSPATAANGANTASRNISRSRRSPATTPRKIDPALAPGRIIAPAFAFERRPTILSSRGIAWSLRVAERRPIPRRALRVHIECIDRLARGHEQAVALHPPKQRLAQRSGSAMRPI